MLNKFEIHDDVQSLVRRIEQLREEGVHDEEIHVYRKHSQPSELGTNFKVHQHNAEGNMFQKFTTMFKDKSAEDEITDDLHLTDEEADLYHRAIEEEKYVLQVDQSAKIDRIEKNPVHKDRVEDDDSVHIDLSQRKDY